MQYINGVMHFNVVFMVDLNSGRLVQLKQAIFFKQTVYFNTSIQDIKLCSATEFKYVYAILYTNKYVYGNFKYIPCQ